MGSFFPPSILTSGGEEYEVWDGRSKGPPRKEKFPDKDKVGVKNDNWQIIVFFSFLTIIEIASIFLFTLGLGLNQGEAGPVLCCCLTY